MKNTRFKSIVSLITALLLMILLAACGGGGDGGGTALAISPTTASVVTGASIQFSANIAGAAWSVNSVAGGNATVGTVDASGVYTAPAVKPTPAVVTVTATVGGQSASAQVTINSLALGGPGGGYFGNYSSVGNLITARSNHTATLLASGDVLVAGGIGVAGAAIAQAELFRNATSNFAAVGSMGITRSYHTATMLQNGKVLVVGGYDNNNNVLATAELYDPAAKTFSATGSMTAARVYHTATLLLNGKVLITGGSSVSDFTTGVPMESVEIFDPATGKFTSPVTAVMTDARFSHSAILLNSGKVLLVGGIGLAGQKLATAELYDPASTASNQIAVTGSMTTPRLLNTITKMSDGTILLVGGTSGTIAGGLDPSATYLASSETYNSVTGVFTVGPVMTDTRGFHTTTLLADSTMLIAGGYGLLSTSLDLTGSSLATAELFNGSFVPTGVMASERLNHTATMLPSSGRVLIIGGSGYSTGSFAVMNSAIVYK